LLGNSIFKGINFPENCIVADRFSTGSGVMHGDRDEDVLVLGNNLSFSAFTVKVER